ncbi:leucine-rich repeat-containing protein 15 [Papilio machaon]|uniref:leucine-rich repeat-containing protein 15 n=1 Tax=Papilio machaon TaxID=76193 RepID=UPI001E665684|nr:leucine-rich repeat-containing protein 15 [Papilio machaon]
MAVTWCVVLLGVLLSIEAKPSCKFEDDSSRHLECSPGDSDYILDKGLVSDKARIVIITLRSCKITSLNTDCFEGLPRLERLDISHNKLTTLPLGVLDKVPKLTYFNASYNIITNLPVGLFKNVQNLIQLDLTGNHLYEINPGLFKKIPTIFLAMKQDTITMGWWWILIGLISYVNAQPSCKFYGSSKTIASCKPGDSDYVLVRGLVSDNNRTTKIILRGCRITDVDYESFENLPALKYLDLSQNAIRFLKLGTLDEALEVTHLNLSYNMLSQFPLGLFDQKTKLLTLDLTGNKLVSFELGIFDTVPKLKYLYLSTNSFVGKDLNPYLFDQNPNLSILDFSRNDMSASPDNLLHALYNLETLNLDRTFLTAVPKFATAANLKSLKNLILSTNQIKRIDSPTVFINLDNLKVLDLSQNNLEFIHENTFKPLRNLVGIILRSNKLTHLPENLFQNVPKLINIELSHNQLKTVSINNFKGTSLKNLNLSDNKIIFLPENFCSELQNIDIILAKLYFLPNPWECACMNELINEVKTMNILYDGGDFDGAHQVCVVKDKFVCDRTL